MDITGPYPLNPRKNKYMLTFIDHFTKYVEAFAISDQTAETCARVYATQIITRHGTGSKLITDQGGAFMSKFFSETCKILRIQKLRTSSRHPISNGTVKGSTASYTQVYHTMLMPRIQIGTYALLPYGVQRHFPHGYSV
jgi:transposase InsO family protein